MVGLLGCGINQLWPVRVHRFDLRENSSSNKHLHFVLAACAVLFASSNSNAQLSPGDDPPPSLGRTRGGENISVADHLGKVQAITFWASWCGPCQTELPLLEKLQRVLGPDKLRVVAVNIEERDQFREATRPLADWKSTLTNDPNKEAFGKYKGSGIPYLLIISRDGKVRQVFRGYSEESVRKVVAAVADAVNN